MYTNQGAQQLQKTHVLGNTMQPNNQQLRAPQLTSLSSGSPLSMTPMQAGQILNLGTSNHGPGQILNLPNGGGQNFYVMIPPTAAVDQQKIAPAGRSSEMTLAAQRTEREEKRRQTHNMVERRRRDKINNWIQKLVKLVPNCKDELGSKQGNQVTLKSKGGILQKTVNFIQELQISHSHVVGRLQEQNQVLSEMAKVRETLKRMEQENTLLRAQLQALGVTPAQPSQQQDSSLKACSEIQQQDPMAALAQTLSQQLSQQPSLYQTSNMVVRQSDQ